MALGAVVLAGVVLRLAGIDAQSFWRDEAATVVHVQSSFPGMLDRLADLEGMPPLYFSLAWVWAQVFGDGEAALRSLSALAGAATVPVAWALGRRLAGGSVLAAAAAAALVATNPFLVWFSQEARPYALLVLFSALATLAFARALDGGQSRSMLWWGLACAGALATHYFAAFLIAPQAAVLLWRMRAQAAQGIAIVAAGALALAPLVWAQRDGRVDWVGEIALGTRLLDVPKHWVAGPFGTPADALGALALLLALAGLAVALARLRGATARFVMAVAILAAALPLALSLAGPDYVLDRYLIAALVPLLAVAGAGLVAAGRPGLVTVAVLSALFAGFTIAIAADEQLHREDWRAVAEGLARGDGPTAIVATAPADAPLAVYLPAARPLVKPSAVGSLALVLPWRFGRDRPASPPPPLGFAAPDRSELPTATVVRFRASGAPVVVDPAALAALTLDPGDGLVLRLAP